MDMVVQGFFTPEEKRNPKIVERASKGLQRPLGVLDALLAEREFLVGDAFSVADLNVAAVMLLMEMVGYDYSNHANVKRWADACYARPSLARARAKD